MKLVVDVNLTPDWIPYLARAGVDAVHWTSVGEPGAPDQEILEWARAEACVIFTHDLDFGTILALTDAEGPSVIQARTHDVMPNALGPMVLEALENCAAELERGAVVTIDVDAQRIRMLPVRPAGPA